MGINFNSFKLILLISAFAVFSNLIVMPEKSFAQTAKKSDLSYSGGASTSIDFNNVDINVFIKYISEITGKNFVVDQKVKGKVTVISPAKISVKDAYSVFESVLEVHGYTTVKSGKLIKIIPSNAARSKSIETRLSNEKASDEDKIVTQLIPLKYADPTEIKRLFTPFISKNSVMVPYPAASMLVVTDTASNIKRLITILEKIDVTGSGQEISVIPLSHANSSDAVKILSTVFKSEGKSKRGVTAKKYKFVADDRTNSVVVLASEVDTQRIMALIDILDKDMPKPMGKEVINVYYLQNANAEDMVKVLESLSSNRSKTSKDKTAAAPMVSGNVKISADKATNSLIIMAEKSEYQILEEVIRKLDIRRAMVYIEVLIMEVNTDKDFSLGSEWVGGGESTVEGTKLAFGGGYSGASGFANTGNLAGGATGVSSFPSGFSLGIFGETLNIGGIVFPSIGALFTAFKKDEDVHILSKPQITTTDNEEAIITVGKNVPYLTSSSSGDSEYSNFEYKDVGITLKITPQISSDRKIKLKLLQEATRLIDDTSSSTQPTTLKRTMETTVIVDDRHTLVLGGLIDDSFTETKYRIPCLGSIPLFGWFFKNLSKTGEKTNLYMFLTPHIIQNTGDAESISMKKRAESKEIVGGSVKLFEDEKEVEEETQEAEPVEEPEAGNEEKTGSEAFEELDQEEQHAQGE